MSHGSLFVVYWALLYTPGQNTAISSYFAHASNSPIMVFEIFFNRLTRAPSHILFYLAQVLGYMFLTWIVHAGSGIWVYSFLDWTSRIAVAYYLGLFVFFVLIYYLVLGFETLRNRFFNCNLLPVPEQPVDTELKTVAVDDTAALDTTAPPAEQVEVVIAGSVIVTDVAVDSSTPPVAAPVTDAAVADTTTAAADEATVAVGAAKEEPAASETAAPTTEVAASS